MFKHAKQVLDIYIFFALYRLFKHWFRQGCYSYMWRLSNAPPTTENVVDDGNGVELLFFSIVLSFIYVYVYM